MMDSADQDQGKQTTIRRITIPPYVEPTEEELAKGREWLANLDRLREKIGPIGISAVDLIDEDFYEIDADGP
jgi:hypothetical protein